MIQNRSLYPFLLSGKAAPYRPNENGIIYEVGPASSMTTTHDRTFTTDSFPAKRNIPRNEPETDKVPKSTMKQDFDYKQATEKVMPYLPPGIIFKSKNKSKTAL